MDVVHEDIIDAAGPNNTIEKSQKAYDGWAKTYDDLLVTEEYMAPKITSDYACKVVPPEKRSSVRVIDVGAGTGLVAVEMRKENFKHIDGLEPNGPMLDIAREKNLYDQYLLEYLTADPCTQPENSYDLLTGSGIYAASGHVPSDALYEMIRLVKPGGYIVLVTRTLWLEACDTNKALEPLMNKLEAQGKWKKILREIIPNYMKNPTSNKNYDAIIWAYQKL